ADNAIGKLNRKINLSFVPAVTFTNPSIATVGLTEEQAEEKGYKVKTSVLPLDEVPRAIVNRQTTGVFKLVADASSLKVLGVHVVSENAGDVIYAATLAVKFGLTVEDLKESLAPYLTMAEGLKLAALTFDKDIWCEGYNSLLVADNKYLLLTFLRMEQHIICIPSKKIRRYIRFAL